jgi:hypothetical protein
MSMLRFLKNGLLFSMLSFLFIACQKQASELNPETADLSAPGKMAGEKSGAAALKGTSFYALTASNELVYYRFDKSLQEKSVLAISGLAASERLLAIDFRPATGELYGVSNASRIYTLNVSSGQATAVGQGFTPAINGSAVGFDFNPTVDRIRLVTNTGQNLRLNPITGMVAVVDKNINPAGAAISAVAYTNSFAGATSTTLYDIDVASNKLFMQLPPNDGTLVLVGSLGVQAVGEAGFDIAPDNSIAIAALYGRGLEENDQTEESNGNKYRFYSINLSTGKAKNAGKTNRVIIGLAISPDA